jgi:hypothetical protein
MTYIPPNPPLQQNVTISGSYGEQLSRVVGPITIVSGVNINQLPEVTSRIVNPVTVASGVAISSLPEANVRVVNPITTVSGGEQLSRIVNPLTIASGITIANQPTYLETFVKGGQIVVASGIALNSAPELLVRPIAPVTIVSGITVNNQPTYLDVFNKGGTVVVASGIAINSMPETLVRPVAPITVVSGIAINGEVLSRVVNPITVISGVAVNSMPEVLIRPIAPVTVASGVSINGEVLSRQVNPVTVASGIAINGEVLSRVVNPITISSGVTTASGSLFSLVGAAPAPNNAIRFAEVGSRKLYGQYFGSFATVSGSTSPQIMASIENPANSGVTIYVRDVEFQGDALNNTTTPFMYRITRAAALPTGGALVAGVKQDSLALTPSGILRTLPTASYTGGDFWATMPGFITQSGTAHTPIPLIFNTQIRETGDIVLRSGEALLFRIDANNSFWRHQVDLEWDEGIGT